MDPVHAYCFEVELVYGGAAPRNPDGAALLALAALQSELESWVDLAFDKGRAPEKASSSVMIISDCWEARLVADSCCYVSPCFA